MRGTRSVFSASVLVLALFFLTSNVGAQSDRGTIAGTIVDSSGGVVEGAAITATGVETGAVYKTVSGPTGAYRIPNMQVGAYNISVAAAGFKTSEHNGFVVQINTNSSLDVKY